MESTKRSIGEWLFQLTTITIGVLIALSADAVLRWNSERTLVNEARATLALEIADNQRELAEYVAAAGDRVARAGAALKLLAELDAGVEPTVREVSFALAFPSLSNAGWQTAERTNALALMDYREVQALAEVYAMQSLFAASMQPAFLATNLAGATFTSLADPFTMSPAMREAVRARVIELNANVALADQLAQQLLAGYEKHLAALPR